MGVLRGFLEELRSGSFERRRGEHCYECEYSIQCFAREWGFEVMEL